jgi:hypothetical protein
VERFWHAAKIRELACLKPGLLAARNAILKVLWSRTQYMVIGAF